VYVLSLCWDREGSTVIGAGVDLSAAMDLAERDDGAEGISRGHVGEWNVTGWDEWDPDYSKTRDSEVFRWSRSALVGIEPHESLYQEIVRVPLTGELPQQSFATVSFGRGEVEQRIAPPSPARDVLADVQEIGKIWGAP